MLLPQSSPSCWGGGCCSAVPTSAVTTLFTVPPAQHRDKTPLVKTSVNYFSNSRVCFPLLTSAVQDYSSQHLSLYSTLSEHPVPPTWDSKIHKATLYQECTRQRVAVSSDVWVNCIKRNLTPAGELSNEEFSPSQPCVCTIPFFWWFGIAIPSLGKL